MNTQIDFFDIYEYYEPPLWSNPWIQASAIFLVIITLGALFYYVFFYRKQTVISSWEWAFREINKLASRDYVSKEDFKNFYFSITQLLKKYLHKRYQWNTEDKTDEELIEFLRGHGFDGMLLERLQKMLQGAVWVKFANEATLRTQIETDRQIIITIIEQTKPLAKK